MLYGIEFKDKRFDTNDENNQFIDLTNNTIVLCSNYKLMATLAIEIVKTVNGEAEYNDYRCAEEDVGKAKYCLNFGLQKVIHINDQTITLCLEPAMIYKAKDIKDIWFCDWKGSGEDYKEVIYPMDAFIGSKGIWNKGLDEVYKNIVSGRYGCYDGEWTKLGLEEEPDDR